MSETVLVALITAISSGAVTALVAAYVHRRRTRVNIRKAAAEAEAIESQTRREEVAYYQQQVKSTIEQMKRLQAEVIGLKKDIENARSAYEQRVGELHGKIDRLSKELERAHETITQLRKEVADGNKIIAGLRDEITKLLVDKAEQKGD